MIPPDKAPTTLLQVEPSSSGRREFDVSPDGRNANLLPLLVVAGGFLARLFEARASFLNPDEALHNLLSDQPSLRLAYQATLTTAHPPLLLLVLYFWRSLGQSEWMLRMPSVLAGTACCWLAYLWLKDVSNRSTALLGLVLFAFAPAMIGLSAEIRQYALLLFFISACLYFSERAIREDSPLLMILFSLSLYGAILVHYSALLFAFAIGVYILVRLYPYRNRPGLTAAWAAGQIGGVALSTYFLVTRIAPLRQTEMLREYYDIYRKSVFHAGDRNPASFTAVQTLRVFTYLFSHGVVGTLALLAFLAGMTLLLSGRISLKKAGPSSRELALLLGLPFAVNCGAALAGQYPYGATRHSACLLLFAISGASIGLSSLARSRSWVMPLALIAALFVCNVFPSPPPPIRAKNQARPLMKDAVDFFRQTAAPGSLVVADYQSGLLFGYYFCGHGVVQVFPPLHAFAKADCGPYTVITAHPNEWKFYADDFPGQMATLTQTYNLAPGTKLWLFDAGWINDSTPALLKQLQHFGCSAPRTFGENILLCEIALDRKR